MAFKNSLQLMLVDPDEDLSFLLKTLLELSNCRVDIVKSWDAALAGIEANPPDLIFTELRFDHAASLGCGKRLRSLACAADVVLVALTSHYYPGVEQDARQAGFDSYLLKPVNYDQILDVLTGLAKTRGANLPDLQHGAMGAT
jgi:CheY-like chemotaxis protein